MCIVEYGSQTIIGNQIIYDKTNPLGTDFLQLSGNFIQRNIHNQFTFEVYGIAHTVEKMREWIKRRTSASFKLWFGLSPNTNNKIRTTVVYSSVGFHGKFVDEDDDLWDHGTGCCPIPQP